jgi:hypothetical protein
MAYFILRGVKGQKPVNPWGPKARMGLVYCSLIYCIIENQAGKSEKPSNGRHLGFMPVQHFFHFRRV